ncbi:hypothetical protein KA005_85945, partial [bacterium]|nr:hypothetical protein [bacterium]
LSPRPEFINAMLISALSRKFKNIELSDIRNRVENRIFFAKKIRVKRRMIEFFVPAKVLGEGNPEEWAFNVFVTGAKTSERFKIAGYNQDELETMDLGVMQPEVGNPLLTFGVREERQSALPIVDLLAENSEQQRLQLKYGKGAILSAVSVGKVSSAGSGNERLIKSIQSWFEDAGTAVQESNQPIIPSPVKKQNQKTEIQKKDAVKDSSFIKIQAIKNRLKSLDLLLQDGVISQQEHLHQRKRILDEM